jgi:hypothetical protein
MKEVENESRKMGLDILNKLNTVDSGVVHTTGNETISGTKTFTSSIVGNVTGDVIGTATNATNLIGSGTVSATTTGGAGLTPTNATNATNLIGSGTVSATTTGGAGLTPTNATNATNATRLTGNFLNTSGSNVASASTISTTGSVFHVTGTTAINTINIPYTGFTGSITIIPDAEFTFGTSGNIGGGQTYCAIANKPIVLTYDGTKWWPVASQDSGSNANGYYIRYSDGTMQCWYNTGATTTAVTTAGLQITYTFPISFISTATLSVAGTGNPNADVRCSVTGGVSSTTTCNIFITTSSNQNFTYLGFNATGKWK